MASKLAFIVAAALAIGALAKVPAASAWPGQGTAVKQPDATNVTEVKRRKGWRNRRYARRGYYRPYRYYRPYDYGYYDYNDYYDPPTPYYYPYYRQRPGFSFYFGL